MRVTTFVGLDALTAHQVDRTPLLTNKNEIVATYLTDDGSYGQLGQVRDDWSFEYAAAHDEAGNALVSAAQADAAHRGGGNFLLWASHPTASTDRVAANAGLTPSRNIHVVRVDLPRPAPVVIETRSFVPGQDDAEWLAVNNRAFADHPEQSGWTQADLEQHLAAPWFNPDDFRIHERDGRVAGFCWTKRHPEMTPEAGEIYVIATDPDFAGHGLGEQLVLAGLATLAAYDIVDGFLYVDGTNSRARALYGRMGFTEWWIDRNYAGVLTPTSRPTP